MTGRTRGARRVAVKVQRLAHAGDLTLPARQTPRAAGLDVAAALPDGETLVLPPGGRALVPTGFVIELPPGFEAQVRPRSGLALKHGVTVLNSPGTIDADYRGEVKVLLINLGEAEVAIRRGDRIAQLVVQPVAAVAVKEVAAVSATKRAAGGFGSTGGAPDGVAQKRKTVPKSARLTKRDSVKRGSRRTETS